MKPILLLALLSAATVNAQVISLVPTSFSLTISAQNNLGRLRPLWQESALDTVVLSNRVLTFTHSVSFRGVPMYGAGGPFGLLDSYSYRQVGAATYYPIGGECVTLFVRKLSGGWIAQTNYVLQADMAPLFFLPAFVGTHTTGDRLNRTVTTGAPLVMSARNLAGSAWLLQLNCSGGGEEVSLLWRFEQGERKQITVAPTGDVEWFYFDLDATTGRAL